MAEIIRIIAQQSLYDILILSYTKLSTRAILPIAWKYKVM